MFDTKFVTRMAAMASAAAAGMLLAAGVPMDAQAAQVFTARLESESCDTASAPIATVSVDDEVDIPEGASLRFVEIVSGDAAYAHVFGLQDELQDGKDSFGVYDIFFEGADGSQLVKQVPADITIDSEKSGYIDSTRDMHLYGVALDGHVTEQGLLAVTEKSGGDGSIHASSFSFHTDDLSDTEAFVGDHNSGWLTVRNDGDEDIALSLSIDGAAGSPDAYSLYFDGERSDSQAADGSILVLGPGESFVIQGLVKDSMVRVAYAGIPEALQVSGDSPTYYDVNVRGAYDSLVVFTGAELADNDLSSYDGIITRDTMGVISGDGVGEGAAFEGFEDGSLVQSPDGGAGDGITAVPDDALAGIPEEDDNTQMLQPGGDSDGEGIDGGMVYDSPVDVEYPDDTDYGYDTQPDSVVTDLEDEKKDIAPKTGDSAKGLIPSVIALLGGIGAGASAIVLSKKKKQP